MRIIINGFGDATFYFKLDDASANLVPVEITSVTLELPEIYLDQIDKHAELRTFLNMLPTIKFRSTEHSAECYTVGGKKESIMIFNALLKADFMLNSRNFEFAHDTLLNLKKLGIFTHPELLLDQAYRWHLRLLHYILVNHDYSVYVGGVYIKELNKNLSTHAADAYQKIKPLLSCSSPITTAQFTTFCDQISVLIKPTSQIPETKSSSSTVFGMLSMRSTSTKELYSDFIAAHEKGKLALAQFNDKLQSKAPEMLTPNSNESRPIMLESAPSEDRSQELENALSELPIAPPSEQPPALTFSSN